MAEEAREGLFHQVPNPVRWLESVRTLQASGVGNWFEAGAGSVLSGLLRSIIPGAPCVSFGEAKDWEKLAGAAAR
jgi:[acyl-carrier-protein] S-malonyltransferase